MDRIREVFDEINQEARSGCVNCGLRHWLYYTNCLLSDGSYLFNDVVEKYDDVIVPCLKIDDKDKVLKAIKDYLSVAESFYDELDYDRVSDIDKYTIATVLSNLTLGDFTSLDRFFERRLDFLQDDTLNHFKRKRELGYSKLFDSIIEVELKKEAIFMETPYGLYISFVKYNDEGRKLSYSLPVVRLGISDGQAYVYAIQKDQSDEIADDKETVAFGKKIRRKMYGVDKGLTTEEKDIKSIDNIHEVSPWALIALTITLGLLKNAGVEKISAYPLLINRYNANVIYSQEELERLDGVDDDIYKEIKEHLIYIKEHIDDIQENISDKFIRTFRRIGYHFPGIDVDDLMLADNFILEMSVNNGENANNPLLQEMFDLGLCYNKGTVKK